MTELQKPQRVYIDGIFDLFHRGHLESLRKGKEFRSNVELVVGVISDEDATKYKRKPVFNEEDRYELVRGCKYADEVILRAPLILTKEFVDRHKIDFVVHGFSDTKDALAQKKFYEQVADIFYEIPYYRHISTTDIINSIKESYQNLPSIGTASSTTPVSPTTDTATDTTS
jgi:cytidyltransferase-like protein